MPATMAPSKTIRLRVSDEIDAALRAYCEQHSIDLSDLLRRAALREIKRRDLEDTMRGMGRPRLSRDPEAPSESE